MNAAAAAARPAPTGPAEVAFDSVTVELGGHKVVVDVTLQVPGGGWLSIIGPNGAGKTTLIRALSGAVRHTGGIRIGDIDASSIHHRERARCLAVVPQHPLVPIGMSTFDYALLGRTPHQGLRFSPSRHDRDVTAEVLHRLDRIRRPPRRDTVRRRTPTGRSSQGPRPGHPGAGPRRTHLVSRCRSSA